MNRVKNVFYSCLLCYLKKKKKSISASCLKHANGKKGEGGGVEESGRRAVEVLINIMLLSLLPLMSDSRGSQSIMR